MRDIRRVLKVTFAPDPEVHDPGVAVIAIRTNNLMFCEIARNVFLVMTPGPNYGGEREMEEDLNENAVGGTYSVGRASQDELDAFDREDGLLHN